MGEAGGMHVRCVGLSFSRSPWLREQMGAESQPSPHCWPCQAAPLGTAVPHLHSGGCGSESLRRAHQSPACGLSRRHQCPQRPHSLALEPAVGWQGSWPNHGAGHPVLHMVQGNQDPRPPLLAGCPPLRTLLQTQLSVAMAREGLPRTGAGERGECRRIQTRTASLV